MKAAIPNILSLFRLLLVPYLFICPKSARLAVLVVGAATDFLDGYLARKWCVTSRFGVFIDPLGDKLFVGALAYLFWAEEMMSPAQLLILFSRDLSLIVFFLCTWIFGLWRRWTIQSFICGKVATALQLGIFVPLSLGQPAPFVLYALLLFFGVASLFELFIRLALRDWQEIT